MERFDKIKEELLKRTKKHQDRYKELYKAKNFKELLQVITYNFFYSCEEEIIDIHLLKDIGKDICNANDLYFNQECSKGYLLVSNATVKALGNAIVKAYNNSKVDASGKAMVCAYGNAEVSASGKATVSVWNNVKVNARDNAMVGAVDYAEVNARDNAMVYANSNVTVRAWGNATVKASGNATVKAYNSSKVDASGKAMVCACDNVTVYVSGKAEVSARDHAKVVATGNVYINSYNTIEHEVYNRGILRYVNENKVVLVEGIRKKVNMQQSTHNK